MYQLRQRKDKRISSLDPNLKQQPQLKNCNMIKTRMQTKNNEIAKQINSKVQPKLVNQTNLPQSLLIENKKSISRSEEDTKVTELDQSENQTFEEFPLRSTSKGNPEIQIYRQDIKAYVLAREEAYMIDHGYLRNHKSLTFKMRSYLVRHIFKVCLKFSLQRSTLYLAVHYMDLYFSRYYTFRDQFEMVSVAQACLFIAMKYEQIYPPQLDQWMDKRQKEEIIRLESQILRALDFQLAHYTLSHFLQFFIWGKTSKGLQNETASDKTLLLMDLSLFDLTIRQFKPSKLAQCLYQMGQNHLKDKNIEQLDRQMIQNITWMLQRNMDALTWLLATKYRHIDNRIFN